MTDSDRPVPALETARAARELADDVERRVRGRATARMRAVVPTAPEPVADNRSSEPDTVRVRAALPRTNASPGRYSYVVRKPSDR